MKGWGSSKRSDSASGRARLVLVLAGASARVAAAQPASAGVIARDTLARPAADAPFVAIGSVEDEARTLRPLTGDTAAATGRLFRSPSSELGPVSTRRPLSFRPVLPTLRSVYNSALPYNANEGNLWAGRGENVLVDGGVIAEYGPVRAVLVPELAYSANRPFQIFPSGLHYSDFASPFHTGPTAGYSTADVPMRFGDQSLFRASLGQSSLTVRVRGAEFGATTESEWWGPAQRVALLMSNAAPSIPRLFARTAHPIHTRLGDLEARVFAGTLTESPYFDDVPANDFRSMVGLAASIAPRVVAGLTVGVERVVTRAESGAYDADARWLDVLRFWTPAPRLTTSGVPADTARADQLFAISARQVFPTAGVEVYGEWARQSPPRSFREFLLGPQESQGYTLGLQWLSAPSGRSGPLDLLRGARVRLGAEASDVEQTVTFRGRAVRDFYSGAATPQGYTQRGQVIGAFTGPGSSSQWGTAELRNVAWQLGSFAGRIRWDNDALYRIDAPNFERHDVSLLGGLQLTRRVPSYDVRASLTYQRRYDYLFQNAVDTPGGVPTYNVNNVTFGVMLAPR